MKKDDLSQFLIDGMKNYGVACDAVYLFRKSLEDALGNILRKPRDWGCFSPDQGRKPINGGHGKDGNEYWISAYYKGKYRSEEVFLAIGAWWHSDLAEDVAFYSCCERLKTFDYIPQSPKVRTQTIEDHTYLFLVPPEDSNMPRDFGLLLDELVNMLNQTKPQLRSKK